MNEQVVEDLLERIFAPTRKAARNLVKELTLRNPHTNEVIDKGTAQYFIEKYSGTHLDGVPLFFVRGGEYFVCSLEFLRQLKQAHEEHKQQQSEKDNGTRPISRCPQVHRTSRRKQDRYHQKQSIRWYQGYRNRNRTQRREVFSPRRIILEKGKSDS